VCCLARYLQRTQVAASNRFDRVRGAVNISDVARRAAVPPGTMSYVLRGKRSIAGATRQRAREAIEAVMDVETHDGRLPVLCSLERRDELADSA
jgi:hypothetical protein